MRSKTGLMEAVHRYEGTVNQVMGDGIMALFGAPLAHEDHAVRACYAALRMLEVVRHYSDELRRAQGQLPARVPARLGRQDLLPPAADRSPAARARRRAARRAPRP
jgi:class 3 adenylate cyclase